MKVSVVSAAVAAGLMFGSAVHASDAYFADYSGNFGTLDLSTGAVTTLGTTHIGASTVDLLQGFSVANGTLYGENDSGVTTLYSVNPSDGALTVIGTNSTSTLDLGSTTSGGLYSAALDGSFYSINTATGAATEIGNLGVQLNGYTSLSDNSNTLYLTTGNGSLYTVNTSTGHATLVGPTSPGEVFDSTAVTGGTLYGVNNNVNVIDPLSAVVTSGSLISPVGHLFEGIVPVGAISSVPAPDAAWLMLGGLVGLGARLRRRRAA